MGVYIGSDGKTVFELIQTDFLDENGSKTYCFTCKVGSHKFAAELENIWFYGVDLLNFAEEVEHLIKNPKKSSASLNAMTDFSCIVQLSDSLGHFTIKTKMESRVHQNSASLMIEAETQTLSNFASELRAVLKN